MGSPDYIAPEQTEDTHAADIRADIFSLGCTLFQMLPGRLPYEGNSMMEKLMARVRRDAPRVASLPVVRSSGRKSADREDGPSAGLGRFQMVRTAESVDRVLRSRSEPSHAIRCIAAQRT